MRRKTLIYPVLLSAFAAVSSAAENSVNFNRDIRPILSNKCFLCHGPDEVDREQDLRLDIPNGPLGALTPRDDYFIIKPGEPEESELWWLINEEDEDDRMPPANSHKEPLNEQEIALFKQWIIEGGEYQDYWAFIPPEKAKLAKVKNKKWASSEIDHIVMASLEDQGTKPNPEADKRTLIRRATFDLTGLPPTLSEIDEFLNDKSRNAYTRLIDGLLSRKSFGEHMARYWADMVRLADTNGMHHDFDREFSTYRDWVIRSYNNNLPFDDFIKYQLAGDLYEDPTREQLVASGFNRLHMIIDKGTALPEESLHKNVIDRVEAFGTTFLGLTVQCAQCHDHKYDPITQKDYYQLYAFFNNFGGAAETGREPERGLQPPFINLTTPKQEKELAEFDGRNTALDFELLAVQRQQGLSDKWPDKFKKVSVPWIWSEPEPQSRSFEFKTKLQLAEVPEKAMARFVALPEPPSSRRGAFTGTIARLKDVQESEAKVELVSEAEVFVNGTSVGKALTLNDGVAAELSGILQAGENVIAAKVSGKAGFALILEYTTGGETKTFTTSTYWKVRSDKNASWVASTEVHDPDHESAWTTKVRSKEVLRIQKQIADLKADRTDYYHTIPGAMIMSEMDTPRQATMLAGGAYDAPGAPVERNTPGFLPPMKKKEGIYSRMDLAEWLVSPEHPLTARVVVNRFWQQLFGVGLVKTSEDFGAQGEWPSHPDLLDELAVSFIESGWDVKQLFRSIALSNTYKQSSDADSTAYTKDPENRQLARGSRYRLDAEVIRDQILAVSGQLNDNMYGKSVKPPQPDGLWAMVNMVANRPYVPDDDDNIYRRSLYTFWRRAMPPPQMTIMNAPSREYCLPRRERTNTPLQALLMMNEEEYFKAAKASAMLTLEETDDLEAGLNLTYEKITSHLPSNDRLKLMEETFEEFIEIYENDQALTESLTPELNGSAFDERVELAAWTMMTHSLLNLELAKVRR
ncbi:MAG: PSD1 and planctomycete cytochrome C domain-containing protein [Opitutales bacterium]|nr:PSD1 and planctomycete cytochrome C domain-containing protein [Opitutales bacterium]